MLTNLSFLNPSKPFPVDDTDTKDRLALYEQNKLLFEGRHSEVYPDLNRFYREDSIPTLEIAINWHKRLPIIFSSFLWGEIPEITSPQDKSSYLKSLVEYNDFYKVGFEVTLDVLRYGTGLFKIGFDGTRATIEAQNPSYWFPVLSPDNIKKVKYHCLCWSFNETTGNNEKKTYLRCEIHSRGKIENRLYELDGDTIGTQIYPISSHPRYSNLKDVQETGINDFLIIPVHNLLTSDRAYGIDDYSDINTIVQQIEIRLCQITRILNKHSSPSMYGPDGAIKINQDTGEPEFIGAGKFYPVEEGEVVPNYLVWDGKLEAAYKQLEILQNHLFAIAEVSPILFGDPAKLQRADSSSALKRLLISTLAKTNRLRLAIDPEVKRALKIASQIEVKKKVPNSTELKEILIEWQDGLPQDELEQAQVANLEGTVPDELKNEQ